MSVIKWLFETNFQFGSKSIPVREVLGGVLGITSAFLGMKRKVAAWPVGIFADAMLFTVFLGAVFAYSELLRPSKSQFTSNHRKRLRLVPLGVSQESWWPRKTSGYPKMDHQKGKTVSSSSSHCFLFNFNANL
jgi:hypothetical protein